MAFCPSMTSRPHDKLKDKLMYHMEAVSGSSSAKSLIKVETFCWPIYYQAQTWWFSSTPRPLTDFFLGWFQKESFMSLSCILPRLTVTWCIGFFLVSTHPHSFILSSQEKCASSFTRCSCFLSTCGRYTRLQHFNWLLTFWVVIIYCHTWDKMSFIETETCQRVLINSRLITQEWTVRNFLCICLN